MRVREKVAWSILCCLVLVWIGLNSISSREDFLFLDESVAELSVDEFRALQDSQTLLYAPLRSELVSLVGNRSVSVYFEDLSSGAWIGVSEKELYNPGSLMKIPTFIAVMKNVEEGEITLDDTLLLEASDINPFYGTLHSEPVGSSFSIRRLLSLAARQSDNTAHAMLRKTLSPGEFAQAAVSSGVPYNSRIVNNTLFLSAKNAADMFRSLYVSGYASRSSSNYILSLLSSSGQNEGLVVGIPNTIPVAYKIGVWTSGTQRHACTLVYHSSSPYVLCVMSRSLGEEEFVVLAESISSLVYSFVDS